MRTKSGEQIYKKVKAKIFFPGNQKHVVKELRAPVGKGVNAEGIDNWLKSLAEAIEKQFPGHEYRLVTLGPASFNFVWERQLSELEVTTPADSLLVSA